MDTENIGRRIQKKRLEKGLSQRQLAALVHVSTAAISKWENGINFPDIQKAKLLADELDIPLSELLREDFVESVLNLVPDSEKVDADMTQQTGQPEDVEGSVLKLEAATAGHPKIRNVRRLITLLVVCIILLSGVVTACYVRFKERTPSFTICEEYYGDYERQKAYYMFIEYTGNPTVEALLEHDQYIREKFVNYFIEVDLIVIAYFEEYGETDDFNSADYEAYLFPWSPPTNNPAVQ